MKTLTKVFLTIGGACIAAWIGYYIDAVEGSITGFIGVLLIVGIFKLWLKVNKNNSGWLNIGRVKKT